MKCRENAELKDFTTGELPAGTDSQTCAQSSNLHTHTSIPRTCLYRRDGARRLHRPSNQSQISGESDFHCGQGSATYQSDLDLLFVNLCQPRDVKELEVVEDGHARYPRLPRLARARAGPHGLSVVLSLRVTARYRVAFSN